MITFKWISSDVVLVLPQLSLTRNCNYLLWWGAHTHLSIQTGLFSHLFEALTNDCLKSEQDVSWLLFRETVADLAQDRPSFLLKNCWFQASSLSSCLNPLWFSMATPSYQFAPSLLPITPQPCASFLSWNNCDQQLWSTVNAQPKGA